MLLFKKGKLLPEDEELKKRVDEFVKDKKNKLHNSTIKEDRENNTSDEFVKDVLNSLEGVNNYRVRARDINPRPTYAITSTDPRCSKDMYYLNIAYEVAKRSTCLRRQYGAVIVKNDEIISTGYNGAPRGVVNCVSRDKCLRDELNIEQGKGYGEYCKSVHAEQNAIISAKRSDMIGATLYLAGFCTKTGEKIDAIPCSICKRFIINSGITKVVSENISAATVYYITRTGCTFTERPEFINETPVETYIEELDNYGENN